ncbi:4-hydroxy-tetrahydrodipicolinate reductase [Zavarzinia sp. CC-PAN008]|uniref:4-hydroxy-tetrahydrodipicolinate reductase n=1 Tax=Zavarzinia sp. CC-PAN008 TaxID=3243332 RepID=UPI003F7468E8
MRIGIVGCAGRMGQALVREIAATEGCTVGGGTERQGSPALGRDLGTLAGLEPLGVVATDDAEALFRSVDVVLDFTSPGATLAHAGIAARTGTGLVVGTTGIEQADMAVLARAGETTRIVFGRNMSLGVNLLAALTRQVAAILGPDFDIEIVEMHHRHKVDAPSGTAITLGEAAAQGRGVVLSESSERGRDGITGARKRGAIGFASLRAGDVVGEHSVIFAADGERVELSHRATDRRIFARGAVRAALWLQDRPFGFYDMADVVGTRGI